MESGAVVAWAYVAEMKDLSFAHSAQPDEDDDDVQSPLDRKRRRKGSASELLVLIACNECLEHAKIHEVARSKPLQRGNFERRAISRCLSSGHLLRHRNGSLPKVRS